jgi:hypothetical protein
VPAFQARREAELVRREAELARREAELEAKAAILVAKEKELTAKETELENSTRGRQAVEAKHAEEATRRQVEEKRGGETEPREQWERERRERERYREPTFRCKFNGCRFPLSRCVSDRERTVCPHCTNEAFKVHLERSGREVPLRT